MIFPPRPVRLNCGFALLLAGAPLVALGATDTDRFGTLSEQRFAECRELLERALPYLRIATAILSEAPIESTSAPRSYSAIRSDLGLRRTLMAADHIAQGLRPFFSHRMTQEAMEVLEKGAIPLAGTPVLALGRRAQEITQQVNSNQGVAQQASPHNGPYPDPGSLEFASSSYSAVWSHGTLARLDMPARCQFIRETLRVLQPGATARLVIRLPIELPEAVDTEMEGILSAAIEGLITRSVGYAEHHSAAFISRQPGATNILLTLTKPRPAMAPVVRYSEAENPPRPQAPSPEEPSAEQGNGSETSWFWGLFGY